MLSSSIDFKLTMPDYQADRILNWVFWEVMPRSSFSGTLTANTDHSLNQFLGVWMVGSYIPLLYIYHHIPISLKIFSVCADECDMPCLIADWGVSGRGPFGQHKLFFLSLLILLLYLLWMTEIFGVIHDQKMLQPKDIRVLNFIKLLTMS